MQTRSPYLQRRGHLFINLVAFKSLPLLLRGEGQLMGGGPHSHERI